MAEPNQDQDQGEMPPVLPSADNVTSFIMAQQQRARMGAMQPMVENPDDASRAMELSRSSGANPSLVAADLDGFESRQKAAYTDEILKNNKYLMDYANSHPLATSVSGGDWGNLDKFSQTLQVAGKATGGTSLVQAAKDFAEGMALDKPIGLFGMDEPSLSEVYAHPGWAAALGLASVAGALPDLGMRFPGGVINAAVQYARRQYEGITGRSGEEGANQVLQTISDPALAATLGPLAPEAEAAGIGLRHMLELRRALPYLKAGEVPPPGVSEAIDKARQDETKDFLKTLKTQEQAANGTNKITGDAEDFKNFVNQHNPDHIELQADAVRTILGKEGAVPGDGKFGDIPGFNEELALAERHNGHVQVPLADWFLFANKNPDEAEFLRKFASRPDGMTEAEGELAKERQQAAKAEEEGPKALGAPPINEQEMEAANDPDAFQRKIAPTYEAASADQRIKRVVKPDTETGDHVYWQKIAEEENHLGPLSGRPNSFYAAQAHSEGGKTTMMVLPDGRRQVYRDGATFAKDPVKRVNPNALAIDSIKAAAGLDPIFARGQGIIPDTAQPLNLTAGDKVYSAKHFLASDALKMVDKDRLTGVPRVLAEFYGDRLNRMAGKTPIYMVDKATQRTLNKRFNITHDAPAFYSPEDKAIIMREDIASGQAVSHNVAAHILIHEIDHAASYDAIEDNPKIKGNIRAAMDETDKYLREKSPKYREEHYYAFKTEHEFMAESKSNTHLQQILALTPVSNELAGKLGLHAKTGKMIDAVRAIVSKLVEQLTGKKPPTSVLDAMFKIHESIEEAKGVTKGGEALGAPPIEDRKAFKTPATVGLKADDLRRYMDLIEKQDKVLSDHIQAKALEDERRRQTSEWKENEKRVRSEVREGVYRRPDIAADRYLREGVLPEGKVGKENQFKIDKGALTDEQLRTLSPDYYSSDGADPDLIAKLSGFQSGDSLVQALGQLKAERDLEGLTPQAHISKLVSVAAEHEMQRQYGDLEENILQEAKEHVFSPTQIDILADETVHLAALAKSELPITKQTLMEGAKIDFDKAPLRSVTVKSFESSAAREGQAVQDALLKGDYRAALKAKQAQTNAIIGANLALKFEKRLKRFKEVDAPRWGRREPPGVPQEDAVWMHQILTQVLGPDGIQTSRQDLERRKGMSSPYATLRDYVEAKNKANGTASTDPDNPPVTHTLNVTPDLFSTNWPGKDLEGLSVDEFNGIYDSLKSINHYGHEANKYEVKGNKEDLAKVVTGLVERLKAAVDNKPAAERGHETSVARTLGSLLLNTETWMNRLDLGKRSGPFNQLIMRPIVEGQNYLKELNRQFADKWKDLGPFPDFNKSLTNTLFRNDQGDFRPMTKGDAYGVLANMGNVLQRRKLIDGWNVSKDQDTGEQMVWHWLKNVAGMGPEDLARAQKMGKVFSDAFTLAEHAYIHTAGVAPARIELYKVRTPWGDADEWYHPLISDPLEGSDKRSVDEMMGESGFWKPSPAAGYTKTRTGARYPLDFSFESVAWKLKQVLNDAAMRIPITEVSKIVYNKTFQTAFKRYYGPEYSAALDSWMKDVAGNRQWQPANMKALDRWANSLMQNMSTMMIGFNENTVAIHGLTAALFSAQEVGFKNWSSSMLHMIHELPGTNERIKFAMDSSEELRNRLHSLEDTIIYQNKELFKTQQNRAFDTTRMKLEKFRDWVHWWGHAPVGFADLFSAVTMWDAEYRRLAEEDPTKSHGDLNYEANTAVRRTHGSSMLANRSQIQRAQSPFARALIPFYNFLGNDMQRVYELAWKSKLAVQGRELPEMPGFLEDKFEKGAQHILPIMGGLAVFAIMPGLIHHMISGSPKKKDESDGAHLAKILLAAPATPIPVVRDITNYLVGGGDPSFGLYGTLAHDVKNALTTKNYDYRTNPGKAFRTATDTLALTTGLTTVPADKLGEYLINVLAGREHPSGFGDLWTGVHTGTQQPPRSVR